jgi:hypothetical protein
MHSARFGILLEHPALSCALRVVVQSTTSTCQHNQQATNKTQYLLFTVYSTTKK